MGFFTNIALLQAKSIRSMIQRIQTIFLLLAAGALGSLFALPFATTAAPETQGIFTDSTFNLYDNIGLIALTSLGILAALIAMFSFKNRVRQLRFGYIGMVISLLIPVIAFLYFTSQIEKMDEAQHTADALGMVAPIAALILFLAANHFIKKDNKLVRSMDRLR
jgi:cytochrome bd-type quinol oxidase subunit 2